LLTRPPTCVLARFSARASADNLTVLARLVALLQRRLPYGLYCVLLVCCNYLRRERKNAQMRSFLCELLVGMPGAVLQASEEHWTAVVDRDGAMHTGKSVIPQSFDPCTLGVFQACRGYRRNVTQQESAPTLLNPTRPIRLSYVEYLMYRLFRDPVLDTAALQLAGACYGEIGCAAFVTMLTRLVLAELPCGWSPRRSAESDAHAHICGVILAVVGGTDAALHLVGHTAPQNLTSLTGEHCSALPCLLNFVLAAMMTSGLHLVRRDEDDAMEMDGAEDDDRPGSASGCGQAAAAAGVANLFDCLLRMLQRSEGVLAADSFSPILDFLRRLASAPCLALADNAGIAASIVRMGGNSTAARLAFDWGTAEGRGRCVAFFTNRYDELRSLR